MNLVSLIRRFLRADVTGRIASALGLDHTAKRSMLTACSAICLGLAFSTSSFAQRKALATCEKEWVEVLANPRGLSVDILNDDTGDLLRSRTSGHTYAVRLAHEAEANNDPRTEARKRKLFFGPC